MGLQQAMAASYQANSYVYFVLAASIIELIAAALNCQNKGSYQNNYWQDCTHYNGWAVAVGAISTAFCLIFAIATCWPLAIANKAAPWLAIFLVLLWIPGAFVTTFDAPFVYTGNGYYASWGAFFFSLLFCQQVGLANFASNTGGGDSAQVKPVNSPKTTTTNNSNNV